MTSKVQMNESLCGYNSSPAIFEYIFQGGQYNNTYTFGETGVNSANGGMAGNYVQPDVIDISTFLSGRENILSECIPPNPMDFDQNEGQIETFSNIDNSSSQKAPIAPTKQQNPDSTILLSKFTKNLRSENAIDSIDYNRFDYLLTNPQNLRFVIEDFAPMRGGLLTQRYTKDAWTNQNNIKNFDPNMCMTVLDPARTCEGCSDVNGFPGRDFITGEKKYAKAIPMSTPPGQPTYPFRDITSQEIYAVSGKCGENFYYGSNYDLGSCVPGANVNSNNYQD